MASSGRGKATSYPQRSAILEWLETPANFRLITGGTQARPVIAGEKLKKTDAYNQLAVFVNLRLKYTDPSEMWDQKIAKVRYESLVKTYKTTRDKLKDPSGKKFGLTDAEIVKGKTIDMKLNELCPFYQRWDNLYGGRQNVDPVHTLEGGVAANGDEATYSAEEYNDLDGNDDDTCGEMKPEEFVHLAIPDDTIIESNDDVERIVPGSSETSESRVPSIVAARRPNVSNPVTINPILRQFSATVAAETPSGEKLTEKRKGDFGSTYSSMKSREIDLMSRDQNRELEIKAQRLELDRKIAADELEFKKQNVQDAREFRRQAMIEEREDKKRSAHESTKSSLMLALANQGKSANEIKEFWALLKED